MSPVAGRMRPKTSASGILTTKRKSPVSTSRFTRMLVPKPKNAFQSPGVQSFGFSPDGTVIASLMWPSPKCTSRCSFASFAAPARAGSQARLHSFEHTLRVGHPPEDASLRLDHAQPHLVELREVRGAAVPGHDAPKATIVGLAHGRVHADLGRDATDDEGLDAAVAEDRVQVGRVEGALP